MINPQHAHLVYHSILVDIGVPHPAFLIMYLMDKTLTFFFNRYAKVSKKLII